MSNAKFDAVLKQCLPSHDLRKVMAAIKQRVSWWVWWVLGGGPELRLAALTQVRGRGLHSEAFISPRTPAGRGQHDFLALSLAWFCSPLPVSLEPPWASTSPSVKWGS